MAKRTLALYLLKPEVGRAEDALSGSASGTYGVGGLTGAKLFLTVPEETSGLRSCVRMSTSSRPTAP